MEAATDQAVSSFAKSLFLGEIHEELVFPFPKPDSEEQDRIRSLIASLREMLGMEDLRGQSFLDIGSGSGLFSLAARRLGARVHSFDYDPHSVAGTKELRRRFFREDPAWTVESGSALDADYVRGLGPFDIVYSWGVLHHTGSMWEAL